MTYFVWRNYSTDNVNTKPGGTPFYFVVRERLKLFRIYIENRFVQLLLKRIFKKFNKLLNSTGFCNLCSL